MNISGNHGAGRTSAVPAVWSAFARASAWKSWMLAGQFIAIIFLLFVCLKVARTEPDVVLVGDDGASTYVPRKLAGAAVIRFLEEQKGRPSDTTVLHFTRDFIEVMFQVNSSTIDEAFEKALSMMDERIAAATREEYRKDKVLETYRLARLKSHVHVEDLVLVEKTESLLHLTARLTRSKSSLLDDSAAASQDSLSVDLVERVVPRSQRRPDGLEIAELSVRRADRPNPTAQAPRASPEAIHAP